MRYFIYLFSFIFTFIFSSNLFAYKNLSKDKVSEILNSQNRDIISLTSGWVKSYDNNVWQEAPVPFTETTKGKVIYKKSLRIEKEFIDNRKLHIYFSGIVGQVEFYFNDELITKNDGDFLPIQLDIPQYLINAGDNELKVIFLSNSKITRKLFMSTINASLNVKGIIREPFLMSTSKIWINDLSYNINEQDGNLFLDGLITCVAGEILSDRKDTTLNKIGQKKTHIQIEYKLIHKQSGVVVIPTVTHSLFIPDSRTANVKFHINCSDLKRWEIDSPELYMLKVELKTKGEIIDDYFVNVGLKTFKINKKSAELNGEIIKIKAITYYEYFYSNKNTLSAYRLEEDIKSIKILGANTVRFTKVPHPYFAYLCDKYGLLMLIDIPLNNIPREFFKDDELIVRSRNMIYRMINIYSRNSSFVAVGLGNEVTECAEYNEIVKSLSEVINNKKILKYKLINLELEEFSTDNFDFLFINFFGKKFQYEYIKNKLRDKKDSIELPILFSFSSAINPNNFNGYKDRTSIEYQAYFIKNCYNISKNLALVGCLINSFNDYETEYPILTLNYYNQYLNTTGLTDIYHINRFSYNVTKALFNDEKIPLLNAGSYENETPISYIIIGLIFTAVVAFMLNRYRRFREYVIRAFLRPYNFYADIRDNRILSISQTLILGAIISISFALCIASILISLRYNFEYSYLLTILFPYNNILSIIFSAVWKPELLLCFLTLLVMTCFFIISLIVNIISKIIRMKISIEKSLTITIWSVVPYIILLPIGIFIARILNVSSNFIGIFAIINVILFIIVLLRYVKALVVVFDKPIIKIYMVMIVTIAVSILLPLFFYENNNEVFAFINYFCSIP